jgi:very-long-chain ceramide synthase
MGFSTLCDIAFGAFVVAWFVTRQVFYPMVIYSVYAYSPLDMAPGCYLSDGSLVPMSDTARFTALGGEQIFANTIKSYTDRTGTICWNPAIRYIFLGLLLALQAIICLWFVMIAKVVYKVLSGQGADDVRSDDEGEDSDIEAELDKPIDAHSLNSIKSSHDPPPLEQEVGVESLVFTCRNPSTRGYKRNSGRNSGNRGSGIVSIPGHGDRKELLGRIGCDKPS